MQAPVDSDTRVPEDCLLDAASEMEQSPEVGIMQFSSGVMQVVHTYFENGLVLLSLRSRLVRIAYSLAG
jgi:cellulose synthase/poly-beta-1,6-N-acetylglucosamine synthase-like glycosyltransferase